jgi:hypothetical protein
MALRVMMVQRIKGRRCDWCEVLRKRPHNEHKNNDVAIVRASIHVPGQLVQVLPLDICEYCGRPAIGMRKHLRICAACTRDSIRAFLNQKENRK